MKLTNAQKRAYAQTELLSAMSLAFDRLANSGEFNYSEYNEMHKAMSDQMARVEKMFDYEPYSFVRGV